MLQLSNWLPGTELETSFFTFSSQKELSNAADENNYLMDLSG